MPLDQGVVPTYKAVVLVFILLQVLLRISARGDVH